VGEDFRSDSKGNLEINAIEKTRVIDGGKDTLVFFLENTNPEKFPESDHVAGIRIRRQTFFSSLPRVCIPV
jgi:hypothetical protein